MHSETARFSALLAALAETIRVRAAEYPARQRKLRAHDLVAQIMLADKSEGRWFRFAGGTVSSGAGVSREAAVTLFFQTPSLAEKVLTPRRDYRAYVEGLKTGKLGLLGPDIEAVWFDELVMMALEAPLLLGG